LFQIIREKKKVSLYRLYPDASVTGRKTFKQLTSFHWIF